MLPSPIPEKEEQMHAVRMAAGAAGSQALLDGFTRYLRAERGVSAPTVDAYLSDVRRFLARRGGSDLGELTAAEVSKAVLGEVASRSPASVRRYGCALRSFLRYCYLAGLIEHDLSAAALPVSGRRRSLLPQGIGPAQAKALLGACDRRRATGRRDYAVIVLMLRLGLRAGEVAALRLEDLDWRAGQVTVHGKGRSHGSAAAAGRRRRGDRRVSAPRPPAHRGAGGVLAGEAAAGRPDPQRGDEHRSWCRAPCRAWRGACAPAAAQVISAGGMRACQHRTAR
jgi:integrase